MNKKKILSILIISLIVLGSVLFVVKSLQAIPSDCDEYLAWCSGTYCLSQPGDIKACLSGCLQNYYNCLKR